VTDEVCRQYIAHMDAMLLGGLLAAPTERAAIATAAS
jgi:hypothetical protein